MTALISHPLTLEEFLKLPETKPASEYIDGKIIQKPMPKGRHSRLQGKLCAAVNQVAEEPKIAYAFPELRCSFGGRSIVPDVAVFQCSRIFFTPDGDVPDNFEIPPDWTIEILSPEQRQTKVIKNILYCLDRGTQLGWLIDPDEQSVIVYFPKQQPAFFEEENNVLTVPEFAKELQLTLGELFGWLKQ